MAEIHVSRESMNMLREVVNPLRRTMNLPSAGMNPVLRTAKTAGEELAGRQKRSRILGEYRIDGYEQQITAQRLAH